MFVCACLCVCVCVCLRELHLPLKCTEGVLCVMLVYELVDVCVECMYMRLATHSVALFTSHRLSCYCVI